MDGAGRPRVPHARPEPDAHDALAHLLFLAQFDQGVRPQGRGVEAPIGQDVAVVVFVGEGRAGGELVEHDERLGHLEKFGQPGPVQGGRSPKKHLLPAGDIDVRGAGEQRLEPQHRLLESPVGPLDFKADGPAEVPRSLPDAVDIPLGKAEERPPGPGPKKVPVVEDAPAVEPDELAQKEGLPRQGRQKGKGPAVGHAEPRRPGPLQTVEGGARHLVGRQAQGAQIHRPRLAGVVHDVQGPVPGAPPIRRDLPYRPAREVVAQKALQKLLFAPVVQSGDHDAEFEGAGREEAGDELHAEAAFAGGADIDARSPAHPLREVPLPDVPAGRPEQFGVDVVGGGGGPFGPQPTTHRHQYRNRPRPHENPAFSRNTIVAQAEGENPVFSPLNAVRFFTDQPAVALTDETISLRFPGLRRCVVALSPFTECLLFLGRPTRRSGRRRAEFWPRTPPWSFCRRRGRRTAG